MDKTITPQDLKHYFQELSQLENYNSAGVPGDHGPSQLTIQNILRYSRALNVLKTSVAGTVYQVSN